MISKVTNVNGRLPLCPSHLVEAHEHVMHKITRLIIRAEKIKARVREEGRETV